MECQGINWCINYQAKCLLYHELLEYHSYRNLYIFMHVNVCRIFVRGLECLNLVMCPSVHMCMSTCNICVGVLMNVPESVCPFVSLSKCICPHQHPVPVLGIQAGYESQSVCPGEEKLDLESR